VVSLTVPYECVLVLLYLFTLNLVTLPVALDYIVSHDRKNNEFNQMYGHHTKLLFHTISVINSITRSSNKSTLSVYGF
jgi:hypothetical protein